MKLIEIIHTGKDEYGNDWHNAVIELDDGSIVYIPEKSGGVEFQNNFQETQKFLVCDNCEVMMSVFDGDHTCANCGEKMVLATYARLTSREPDTPPAATLAQNSISGGVPVTPAVGQLLSP